MPVRERQEVVQRIHPSVSVPGRPSAVPGRISLVGAYPRGYHAGDDHANRSADRRSRPLPSQLHARQGAARAASRANRGPGPRDHPDDRARGVLRRHPPADERPARGRRLARGARPRGPRDRLRAHRRRPTATPTATSTRSSTSSAGRWAAPCGARAGPELSEDRGDAPLAIGPRIRLGRSRTRSQATYPRSPGSVHHRWITGLTGLADRGNIRHPHRENLRGARFGRGPGKPDREPSESAPDRGPGCDERRRRRRRP